MFNSKFNGLLTALLIIAIIGIIGLIGYIGWATFNKYNLNSNAHDAVEAYEETVSKKQEEKEEESGERPQIGSVGNSNSIYGTVTKTSTEKTKYYGYEIVGTISIPKIDIEYPILEKVTPQSIKVAVAYLSGAGINKVGNTVIQGHNYRNGLFFSNLKKLTNGNDIYITDERGNKVKYQVYKVFEADATDTSFYKRDTAGLREITLSTCTDNGELRTIVLAKEV